MKKEFKGNTIGLKIPMFILVIGYLIYFIYTFITKDYNFNDKFNKINLVLIFISVFLLGCSAITNSRRTIFYTVSNYIVVFILIGTSIYSVLPKDDKNKNKIETMICNGSTESSENTEIEINYSKGKIKKLTYTYIFDLKNKTGAENLVNRFDKQYADFTSIYSEIEINDKVTVKLTFNLENVSMETVKSIDENITDDFNELKEKQLNNLKCEIKNVD